MKTYTYQPKGVCARQIHFSIEDGKLHQVHFDGGCPGNLSAIGKLLEGRDAKEASALLRGNLCADQLAQAIEQAIEE